MKIANNIRLSLSVPVLTLTVTPTTIGESGSPTVAVCVDASVAVCPDVTVDFGTADGRCYTDFAGSLVSIGVSCGAGWFHNSLWGV